jgi:hypothetical protein
MACRAFRATTRQGFCFRRYRRCSMLRFEDLRLRCGPYRSGNLQVIGRAIIAGAVIPDTCRLRSAVASLGLPLAVPLW